MKEFTWNELILKSLALKRDSSTPPGAFKSGRFVLHHLIPLQIIKPGMSIEGVRNVINKLTSIHNIGGLLFSFDLRYFKNMKKCKFHEDEMERLDEIGQLLQRWFTFVDDIRAQKKVENDICDMYPELNRAEPFLLKYPNVGQMEEYTDLKLLSIGFMKLQVMVEDEKTLVIKSSGKRKHEDGEEEGCK
ncbi:hypothetical protein EZV62_003129 [Acer yangbiense]|uniref:Uncharacterized protein n=1 Tax=Acer yangbiense TaxID=1000413 RepID=A0A5C7IGS3_9ROSI|nr:hypothetical protein EZV62_003129 [Acer yangbiense]